ncbi:MAG: sigma-54-dependent Fis family transcriptional regulator [Deferribacteres bacterium]|nr:sigma-54-dependent Fis family transcriptional regulator [candidate division KSB1 bacterium]MCB9510078.1 sigma-54-dependent Fis family transcriptional regulator [Deferribacteres bacterium]
MAQILVVDDDRAVRRTLVLTLKKQGYEVQEAQSSKDALRKINREIFDVVISDLVMQDGNGMDVLKHAKSVLPDTEVIMMTAFGAVETAVEAIRSGAYEYLTKPMQDEALTKTVAKAMERNALRKRIRDLERSMRDQFGVKNIITVNQVMQQIIKKALAVSGTDSSVLITGESGTGKELIAGMIHHYSHYAEKPFVPVNCGGLPEQLLESELFGHVKGAFTGAISSKRGLVEEADGGTLFLDEIAEMSPTLQVKLLRFIQNGEIRRVGDNELRRVSVRIIAATNKDLHKMMASGEFREDLFYRVAVIPLHLPPLRDRDDDISLLAQHFLRTFAEKSGKSDLHFSQAALHTLTSYRWPGNVRELMNAVEHGVALSSSAEVDTVHLPPRLLQSLDYLPPVQDRPATLAEVEKHYILKVLRETNGSQKKACKILDLSKTTLYRRLKEYDIQPKDSKEMDSSHQA